MPQPQAGAALHGEFALLHERMLTDMHTVFDEHLTQSLQPLLTQLHILMNGFLEKSVDVLNEPQSRRPPLGHGGVCSVPPATVVVAPAEVGRHLASSTPPLPQNSPPRILTTPSLDASATTIEWPDTDIGSTSYRDRDKSIIRDKGAFSDIYKKKQPLHLVPYKVEDFYHKKGMAQWISLHPGFQGMTLFVLAVNCIYLGFEEEFNTEPTVLTADLGFQICEHFFCAYFTLELLLRFAAFRFKLDAYRDWWFRFDSLVVFLMVGETWILSLILSFTEFNGPLPIGPLRIIRLLRLCRLGRLMKYFPELMTLTKALRAAVRAVSSSMAMVMLLVYAFAIITHMALAGVTAENLDADFGSVLDCMWTLLIYGTLLDSVAVITNKLRLAALAQSWITLIIFLIFIFMSALTLMNMLIGVLCEVVSSVSIQEQNEAAVNGLKDTVLVTLNKIDTDGNKMISQPELREALDDYDAQQVLRDLGMDPQHLKDMQGMLYSETDEVPIDQIMEMLLLARDDVPTTFRQISENHHLTRWTLSRRLDFVSEKVDACLTLLNYGLADFMASAPGSGPKAMTRPAMLGRPAPEPAPESNCRITCKPNDWTMMV
eukprot:NODE_2304_length_2241_cov_12.130558.p1 GENE.NODE_2304_length_2241_cov_12.130558~~NODE_2304_length_2241_cov_12.130558.p1  ORF type:complete len:601 (-),score=122.46 NODE_2304_length_2241_cov_12.130558:301-2103(-)